MHGASSTTSPVEKAGPAVTRPVTSSLTGKILLVEDNRDILRATQRILATQNHDVSVAADGEEALARARDVMPDVILLDVMIPKIDGLEVCRRLKADPQTSGIMVIHVTGRGSVDNRVEGFDAGADDYIPKPFHVPELLARIRSALRIKRLTDSLAERNRQLQKSQTDLIQAEKMATIGLLASGIAHEFNNIMAGISGYAQLAKKNPKFQAPLVDVALLQTERALELTRSLSSYNRRNDGNSSCDAAAVIESALCLVVKEVERAKVTVERCFEERPALQISAGQLQEVVLNMVLNAIQAIDGEGGQVRIRVLGAESEGRSILEISDNGQGIAPANLTRIFDPFFTTKGALGGGKQPGTGLGLTVSYNIVQGCSGRIDVSSTVGKGTTFRITLPKAKEKALSASMPAPGATAGSTRGRARLRLLVVDDEEPVRDIIRDYLSGQNVEIVCHSSGDAALIEYSRKPFDFVLLDVGDSLSAVGFELFDRFSEFQPSPRIVLSSGRRPEPIYQRYLDRAHGHLLKPFKSESLAALLGLQSPGQASGLDRSGVAQSTEAFTMSPA